MFCEFEQFYFKHISILGIIGYDRNILLHFWENVKKIFSRNFVEWEI